MTSDHIPTLKKNVPFWGLIGSFWFNQYYAKFEGFLISFENDFQTKKKLKYCFTRVIEFAMNFHVFFF